MESPSSDPSPRGGDLLLDLLRLSGWQVLVHSKGKTTAVAKRGSATVMAQAATRPEAMLRLFESAIESRRASRRAA